MSAFIVSKAHIDHLVDVAIDGPDGCARRDWYPPAIHVEGNGRLSANQIPPSDLGALLVKENLRSIQARYPDTIAHPEDAPGPGDRYYLSDYVFTHPSLWKRLTAVQALKALHCYEYQACESDDWDQTAVFRFCRALEHALVRALPGYDAADWEVRE